MTGRYGNCGFLNPQRVLPSSYWQLRGVIVHWHREDTIHCLQQCGAGSWHTYGRLICRL